MKKSIDLFVLIFALGITFIVWKYTQDLVKREKSDQVSSQVDLITQNFNLRMRQYGYVLNAAQGFFAASESVSRDEFIRYFESQDVSNFFPGIYGITYLSRVSNNDIGSFLENLQKEINPLKVYPQIHTGDEHYIVNYVTYGDDKIAAAYGYDLMSDPLRREALMASRDTDSAVISEPVMLKGAERLGFIMIRPIYKPGNIAQTVDQRRDALTGFVNTVFVYEDFFKEVFSQIDHAGVEIHIKDGNQTIFDSLSEEQHRELGLTNVSYRSVDMGGREWFLEYFVNPNYFQTRVDDYLPNVILVVGIFVSILSFGIVFTLSSSQARAIDLADRKTIELREKEKVMRSQNDRMNAIVASMGEGLIVVNKEGIVEVINKIAANLFEITISDAIGKKWSDIISTYTGESEVPIEGRSFARAISEGKTFVTKTEDNHYYKTLKGRKFPVASVTSPLFTGNHLVGAIKVFRDVTDDKEEKQKIEKIVELRTSELTASIAALPLGFIIVDKDHEIIAANRQMEEILGKGEINNFNSIVELFEGVGFDFKQVCNHCRGDYESYENNEVVYKGKSFKILSVPVAANSKLLATAILVDDVTESKILERSKDEFFSIASHELRTPLTAIRGNTSMLMEYFVKEIKDTSVKEMISDIHDSAVRLIGIVNDFLDLSRLEQRQIHFKKERFNIVELAKEVVEELGTGNTRQIELKVRERENLPQLFADKNKTKEVLINLVGNSLKYTDSGSVTVSFEVVDHMVETFVSDTGRGVSPNLQPLLFRKFQQAGESITTRDTTKGTGLGLYISKLMVEGMGGRIRLVESRPNQGSIFSFTLPQAKIT